MIEDNLKLPFVTKILGMDATVETVDLSSRNDIIVVCRRRRERQLIRILDLPLSFPGPFGWDWIVAYRHWARG